MAKDGKTVILVADDEPSMLAIVASHLRAKGYMVLEASDGDQAWELAHEHLPDLVVLDVMMPGMSGWEVCRKIREAVSLAHTGVVMLTGIGENLNEMTSPLYGADGYVDKPFEFPQLDKRIQEALERRRAGAVGRLDGSEVEVAADETNSVDQGWSDPGTMPGVGDEEKPARAKKPKAERAAKTKPPPAAKPEAKPAKTAAKKPAKAKAKPKPKAKAKPAAKAKTEARKPAKARKKAAKAAAKKPAKAKSKAKVSAKPAAKTKAAKPAAKGKAKPAAKGKAKPAARGRVGKPGAKTAPAKPAAKKAKAEVSKLSAPAMKSAARTAKKPSGKKK